MDIFHILIADAREEILQDLRARIAGIEGIELTGEAHSELEILELIHEQPVDLLIVGWQSPGLSGPQVAGLLDSLGEPVQVIFWGIDPETTRLTPRKNLNVKAYIQEDTSQEEFQALMRQIRDEGNLSRYAR